MTEMGRLFPSIPLVAEEDSASLRVNNLVDPVVDVVTTKATFGDKLTEDDVLKAIDRGGKDAYTFDPSPATYWVGLFWHVVIKSNAFIKFQVHLKLYI